MSMIRSKMWTDFFYEYGLYINHATPPHMTKNHSHYEMEVLHICRGSARLIIGEQTYTADCNNFFLFWATTPHRLVEVAPDSECYEMMIPVPIFFQAELEQQIEGLLISSHVVNHHFASASQRNIFYAYLDQWFEDQQRGAFQHNRHVSLEIGAFLRRMQLAITVEQEDARPLSATGSPQRQRDLAQVGNILRYMATHFQEPLSAADIARQIGRHPDYAASLFRRFTGKTFLQYLTEYRVQHAIGLLQNTERNVIDVALDCGFRSSSQFYAAFKKVTGRSPTSYRA